jgi:hypothetical protein
VSNLAGVVKQIEIATEGNVVAIELICGDAYAAQVLSDDLVSRLKTDHVLSMIVKVGAVVGDDADA